MKAYVEDRFDDRYTASTGKALWLKISSCRCRARVRNGSTGRMRLQRDLDGPGCAGAGRRGAPQAGKDEIARGQKENSRLRPGLPANLQAVGKAAEQEVKGRFDELREGVDDKKATWPQKLAQRYKDASDKARLRFRS